MVCCVVKCLFLVINLVYVPKRGSINGLILDHILNLGGRKALAKLQWYLDPKDCQCHLQVADIESTSL